MKGIPLETCDSLRHALGWIMRKALQDGVVDHVLVPSRGPEDSFPWILAARPEPLSDAEPIPPVMSVQGARALSSVTGSTSEGAMLAVMRPCEARASIEVAKLRQSDLSSVVVLTMDCPGAVPLARYRDGDIMEPDPEDPESLRPLCRQCTGFTAAGDLCLVRSGENVLAVPLTEGGRRFAAALGLDGEGDLDEWLEWKEGLGKQRERTGEEARQSLKEDTRGLSGLAAVYSGCVGCRSCRTVCPVCYCRLCFIDMKDRRSPAAAHLDRSVSAGAARLVSDTLLFHIGRMAHMSLSCVACGMCEDACPADIPVGRLVSMVGRETAALFDYTAGEDPDEPLPLSTFLTEELHDFED
ncbi:MAG: (Fe-S)-binding protein [Candidatus Fermentibacteraceae bacterium]|nr:(Fe-S)-binding protein [Candidatus Fermentibacteraceae bacterium]MBN2608638.1 (Fe-S)-binding protein [Candidatus Fermentibacteraceae bacterium]